MEVLSPLLPLALALLAFAAASSLSWGRQDRPPPLRWLDTGLLFFALLVLPAYALGWLSCFSAWAVGGATAGLCLAVLLWASRGRPAELRRALSAALRLLASPLRLTLEAFAEGRWLRAFALGSVILVWAWTALLMWIVPSSGWDGIWYHDSIVGFTIQNHGFAWVELPAGHQLINGYPRLSETLAAVFVALSDDRYLEIGPTLTWPLIGLAFAALSANLGASREGRIVGACVFVLVPAMAMQLRSSYVDLPPTFFILAALAYLSRPRPGPRDLVLAALAVGMLCAAKATGLVFLPIAGGIALARTFTVAEGWAGLGRRAGALLLGLGLIVAIGAPTYVRNYQEEENPLYPVAFESEALGLELRGPASNVIANPSLERWLANTYGLPQVREYHHDVRPHGYGHALPFLLPLWLLIALIEGLVTLLRRRHLPRRRPGRASAALWLTLAGAAYALGTPPIWWGRFGAPVLAILLAMMVGWLATRPRTGRLFLGLALLVHVATLSWAKPGWHSTPTEALPMLFESAETRATQKIGPVFGDPPALLAFEREVGPGDVVVWTYQNGFPSFAWNRHMSNRSVFLPERSYPRFRERAEELGARWVIVTQSSGFELALRRDAGYERVGRITDILIGYRRRLPSTPPASTPTARGE